MDANQRSSSIEMRAYGYRLLARLNQLAGNATSAGEYLQKALKLAAGYDLSPLTLSLNAAMQVEMALTDGDLYQAERAAPQVTNSLGLYTFIFYPEIARVHLHIVNGRREEALKLLEPVMERVEQAGWEYPRLQVRVLQALIAQDPAQARLLIKEALELAQPCGAERVFVDLGEPMRVLLRECGLRIEEPHLKTYALRLLAAFPGTSTVSPGEKYAPAIDELVEPLSEREIEVLRMIANGLSNGEIAQKLYLSTNTLKAHTQNIYSKLDVHSRVQAVNRARELQII
jgi:LuxR family maltose regulon positive regulatory protein